MTNYKKEDEESAGVRNETRLRFLHEGSLIKKWHRGEMVRGMRCYMSGMRIVIVCIVNPGN